MKTQEEKYAKLYKKAKSIIGDSTPLSKDCGKLCSSACCKGDSDTGMILFPFEKTSLEVKEKNGVRLAVCGGSCDRSERPLSCMIFPFFPVMDERGKITVKADFRGVNICPMIDHEDKINFSRGFLWRVKKVGRLLKEDELCREFLVGISEEIVKIEALYSKKS